MNSVCLTDCDSIKTLLISERFLALIYVLISSGCYLFGEKWISVPWTKKTNFCVDQSKARICKAIHFSLPQNGLPTLSTIKLMERRRASLLLLLDNVPGSKILDSEKGIWWMKYSYHPSGNPSWNLGCNERSWTRHCVLVVLTRKRTLFYWRLIIFKCKYRFIEIKC